MKDELKSCPFCGSKAIVKVEHDIYTLERIGYRVYCSEYFCAEINKLYNTIEEAIEAWNKRVKAG